MAKQQEFKKDAINLQFKGKGFFSLSWAVYDEVVEMGDGWYGYGLICNVSHDETRRVICFQGIKPQNLDYALDTLPWGGMLDKQLATTFELKYEQQKADDAATAYEYIKAHSLDAKVHPIPSADENGVFRMKCNSCNKVFSFTREDIVQNARVAKQNKTAALGQLGALVSGNQGAMIALGQHKGQVRFFNHCPYCNSRDTEGITAEEMEMASGHTDRSTVVSSADEILKLKDLLDAGVLTQEEFDAAKKRALGL